MSKDFALNHSKELDKAVIKCRLVNLTKTSDGESDEFDFLCSNTTRLFFNKRVIPLGRVLG